MKRDVFVSKPNALNLVQALFWHDLDEVLKSRGLNPRSLGSTDYPNSAPAAAVKLIMEHCQGAIILGLQQMFVSEGTSRAGTNVASPIKGIYLPTPWNHLEAGMAVALGLPLLIIREQGVTGGVFDHGSTDRFVHEVDLSGMGEAWLTGNAFLQPFNEWHEDVLRSHA